MPCRGAELSGNDLDILLTKKGLCTHLGNNRKLYETWANKAVKLNEGITLPRRDVIAMIESAIRGLAAQTGLNKVADDSDVPSEQVVSIMARAVYPSTDECVPTARNLSTKC